MLHQHEPGIPAGRGETGQSPAEQPIDHAHLRRYTMGNRELEVEVLQLFAGQAPSTLRDLTEAQTQKAWHIAAHTLKGSARAVGAWQIAKIAADAETAGPASSDRGRLIDALRREIAVAADYIDGLACPA